MTGTQTQTWTTGVTTIALLVLRTGELKNSKKNIPVGNLRRRPSWKSIFSFFSWIEGLLTLNMVGSIGVTCRSKIAKIITIGNPRWLPYCFIYTYIGKTIKNLFVWNQKALGFDIWLHSFIYFTCLFNNKAPCDHASVQQPPACHPKTFSNFKLRKHWDDL